MEVGRRLTDAEIARGRALLAMTKSVDIQERRALWRLALCYSRKHRETSAWLESQSRGPAGHAPLRGSGNVGVRVEGV
jgi:hypothetical protein